MAAASIKLRLQIYSGITADAVDRLPQGEGDGEVEGQHGIEVPVATL
jgi:hypothetical protein